MQGSYTVTGGSLCAGDRGTFSANRNAWTNTTILGAPEARVAHTAVWGTGDMLVWGGHDGNTVPKNSGGRFDPQGNSWTAITTTGAPTARWGHTAVWTGSEMIIWGGSDTAISNIIFGDGARYDPQTDTWTAMSSIGAPSARVFHPAVWTGTEMMVWGGASTLNLNVNFATGARYNPATDTWTPIAAVGSPSGRCCHSAGGVDSLGRL